ncbi:hypothetical protein BDC45DRAFT_569686 [Circinella umbellata]|nr:hypothetical protein BDC45DRAFT_569686 [Circinella umbellata]
MVSSSSPFSAGRTLKNLFKDSNHARTSNVSLNSEPAPSSSGTNRRQSISASSSHHGSNSHHHQQQQQKQKQKQQQRFSSAQSEPPLHDRPLPPSPQPKSSSRPPVSKHNNKRKDSTTPFYKRFSRVPSVDEDLKETYSVYLSMDNVSMNNSNESNVSSLQQRQYQSQQQPVLPPIPPHHSSYKREDSASVHSGSSGNNISNIKHSDGGSNNSSSNSIGGNSSIQQHSSPPKEQLQPPRQQEKHEAPLKKIPKSAVQKNRTTKLLHQIEELKTTRDQESLELESRYYKLQHTLDAKEAELNRLSANFHKHIKTIRATDDDFSTIRVNLTMLQSKIATLPLSLKKYADDRALMTQYFASYWPELKPTIEKLCKKKGALDYNIICLFVEKLVTEELVSSIYHTPIIVGLPTNEAYLQISEYMATHDKDWALRLRQQMCKLAVKSIATNDAAAKPITAAKKEVVNRIISKLGKIYSAEGHEVLNSKITKFVDTACELSAAMHSQDVSVDPAKLVEGKDTVQDDLVTIQNGSLDNATMIRVVVCPPFTASEKQTNDVVLMKGKVICM